MTRYEGLFETQDWTVVAEKDEQVAHRGRLPHPEAAYSKALLVMLNEKQKYVSDVRGYVTEYPAFKIDQPRQHTLRAVARRNTFPHLLINLRVLHLYR